MVPIDSDISRHSQFRFLGQMEFSKGCDMECKFCHHYSTVDHIDDLCDNCNRQMFHKIVESTDVPDPVEEAWQQVVSSKVPEKGGA